MLERYETCDTLPAKIVGVLMTVTMQVDKHELQFTACFIQCLSNITTNEIMFRCVGGSVV